MKCYKVVLTTNQNKDLLEIENFTEGIRSTLNKEDTKFSVFSVKSGNIISIYFSPSAFKLCETVLSEKFGFESCDCLEEDLET